MAEMFDIFDGKMNKIGTDTRENAHAQGLWHQTFHCWIFDRSAGGEGRLLFQLRHKNKDTFPGLLDTSCAGHLRSGETVEDGVRELEEELGLSVSFAELLYCGTVAEENVISDRLIDREYNHIFIYECSQPLEEYHVQTDEVSGLYRVNIRGFRELLSGALPSIEIEGMAVDDALQRSIFSRRTVAIRDFTPATDAYYRVLFDNIDLSN